MICSQDNQTAPRINKNFINEVMGSKYDCGIQSLYNSSFQSCHESLHSQKIILKDQIIQFTECIIEYPF